MTELPGKYFLLFASGVLLSDGSTPGFVLHSGEKFTLSCSTHLLFPLWHSLSLAHNCQHSQVSPIQILS